MLDRRRIVRQPCDLDGRINIPKSSDALTECQIIDISSHGAFIRPKSDIQLPPSFDLIIGRSNSVRTCRLARVTGNGVGVEFLDLVRAEIEEALIEAAFEEEFLFDQIAGVPMDKSQVGARLRRAVAAMMDIVEKRNEMAWQRSKAA